MKNSRTLINWPFSSHTPGPLVFCICIYIALFIESPPFWFAFVAPLCPRLRQPVSYSTISQFYLDRIMRHLTSAALLLLLSDRSRGVEESCTAVVLYRSAHLEEEDHRVPCSSNTWLTAHARTDCVCVRTAGTVIHTMHGTAWSAYYEPYQGRIGEKMRHRLLVILIAA